ncbi:hypothetical protein A1O7_09480 [Cladophialophora yegresii CBS 114405]|uniref:Uncharacterized protein n=1 Tax=Cladophialophora yegresii CBS 114405 TaxID=1182544 RepID=W9VF84_9EURO|nr:uncharacterized protein A1O7_09480 [Cladophialophora yegresii CBS 114405]EXJ54143.1 hypothetical protein A1O7_09480 [Cladophialophora yegresii CBS 114405]
MQNWRERGYVPDSDDDEEDRDSDVQHENSHDNITVSHTGEAHDVPTRAEEVTVSHRGHSRDKNANVTVETSDSLENRAVVQRLRQAERTAKVAEHELRGLSESDDPPTSTATRLEAEIQKGLRTVRDVLESAFDSDSDSPLSSVPPSAQNTPRGHGRKTVQDVLASLSPALHDHTGGPPSLTSYSAGNTTSEIVSVGMRPAVVSNITVPPLQVSHNIPPNADDEAPRRRSFRPRAPIQLHPYALEDAKYRQTWSASGLKPVRAPEITSRAEKTSNEESQDTTAYESSQMDSFDRAARDSSPTLDAPDSDSRSADNEESQSPIPGTRVRQPSPLSDLSDDLPDVSEMLNSPNTTPSVLQLKKSKKRYWREPRTGRDGFHIYDLPNDDSAVQPAARIHHAGSATPLSPPWSRAERSSQDVVLAPIADVAGENSTPAGLPTPLVSSDKHASKRPFAEILGISDSESDIINVSDEPGASSSSEQNSGDESLGVQRLRRKIKGVLPASWLKLDMKQNQKPRSSSPHRTQYSPIRIAPEKGVAKHIPSSGRHVRKPGPMHIIQDEPTDMNTSAESDTELQTYTEMDDVQYDLSTTYDDDVMEDNTVDAMLAPRVRNSAVSKRQRRLSGAWSRKGSETSRKHAGGGRPAFHSGGKPKVVARSKKLARPRKKIKRSHRNTLITILDAPGFKQKDIPRFLRIASRRCGDTTKARHQDPSKKFFRLATERDTQDVNESLKRGRTRRHEMHPAVQINSSNGVPSRTTALVPQPRAVNSANHEVIEALTQDRWPRHQGAANLDPQLNALKRSTKITLQRVRHNLHQAPPPLLEANGLSAGSPSAILDYFKPRTSYSSHLISRRLNRVELGPTAPEEASGSQLDEFAIQKRIPRLPGARRQRSTHGLARETPTMAVPQTGLPLTSPPPWLAPRERSGQNDVNITARSGDLSQPPREPFRPRLPKKQRPLELGTRTYEHGAILCLQSLVLDEGMDIITNTVRYPPGGDSLLNTGIPPGAEPVRSTLIRATLSSMANSAGLFEPGWIINTNTTPKSQHTLEAAGWSSGIEAILRDIFKETLETICKDAIALHLSTGERIELLKNAADSIEALVVYVNESLTFPGEHDLEAFLLLTSRYMEEIWRAMAECEATTSDPLASHSLKVLNGLLLLGYQTAQRAVGLTSPNSVGGIISEVRKNMARFAWELAFREEHIARLFAYISAPAGIDPAPDTLRSRYTAEIETILLVHTLGPHQGWGFYMGNIFLADDEARGTHQLQSRAESLSFTVLVLGCILSVSGSEGILSTYGMQSSISLGSSLSDMLVGRVSEFLKAFIEYKTNYSKRLKKQSPPVKKLAQFGLTMVRWCFLLARNYLHELADDLLKAMFKYYSENGMTGLFSPSAPAGIKTMPHFLKDQVPAQDLLPADNDTDFDIVLKLTAIALTPRLAMIYDTAEHMKKFQLRKRSLLFLMLPNRGRDLTTENLSVFDEDKDLALTDFAGIANRYSLFATLYHYAPNESKPVLAQISNYVDFSTAHNSVREVILECWTSLVRSVLAQPSNSGRLQELGHWIRQMFFSMCTKLDNIPQNNNINAPDETLRAEYHVHRINRVTTIDCLCQVAARFCAAVGLCANAEQVSCLLPQEELSSLILRCYTNQGLGDNVVCQVFSLLTSYIKRGLKKEREAFLFFRRDLRGLLVDQLTRNREQDEPEFERLLVSMAETWYALGRVMVTEGSANWDQFLNDWSPMSFPQIADVENGRHCQVLLMSKIAAERDVVLAEPYPFIQALFRSVLGSVLARSKISFIHRLLNQLIESIPDAFALDGLRHNLSGGVRPFFLDKFDVINHRFAIVDHFIRYAYVVRPAADGPLLGDLTDGQWNDLMTMIPKILKRTMTQDHGGARADWMTFSQKVLFRLTLYGGPSFGSAPLLAGLHDGDIESTTFRLERLFVTSPRRYDSTDPDNGHAAKLFLSAVESACLRKKEDVLVSHMADIFAASNPDYIEDDGSFLLDISEQLDFLKGVFPVYIESALDDTHPTMLFAIPVLDIAIDLLKRLEARIDLEDQARMESFAELITVWMRAAVKAMQHSMPTPLKENGWQIETVCRLVDLVAAGGGRWAHLHNLFPTSIDIVGFQESVQAYACYTYDFVCSTAGFDFGVPPSDPTFWEERIGVESWTVDFGFETEDVSVPERISTLKNDAAKELRAVGRDWCKVGFTTFGPVWELHRGGSPAMAQTNGGAASEGTTFVALQEVAERLQRVLVLLGLVDEVL